jgi:DNA adenine methylase
VTNPEGQQSLSNKTISMGQVNYKKTLTPPLKWAGGKRWLLPHLEPIWQPYCNWRLVEPFCGGLAIVLGLRPQHALLNDINPHAINFYQWLQKGLQIQIPMRNDKDLYYKHRTEFNRLVTGHHYTRKKAAEIFYYLNRTGYNGLCRFNRKGEFNVPFGRYKVINYLRDFTHYKEALSPWQFTNVDFEELSITPEDFIYADPPYDVEFRQYAKDGFEWPDQERLANWLVAHPGPVVASNQATKRVLELYGDLGFQLTLLDAPRMISCTGDRSPAKEMLAVRGVDLDGST